MYPLTPIPQQCFPILFFTFFSTHGVYKVCTRLTGVQMHMFRLKDEVIVVDQLTPTAGRVWGRTFESTPRYNVLTDTGTILKDIPATHLRLVEEPTV